MRRSGFKRKNKYGAIKTMRDGVLFDSKLEAFHYDNLKLLQLAGEIRDLELQHEMPLKIGDAQICIYIADYRYFDIKEAKWVISDAKGIETDVFRIKWKIAQVLHPENIYELRKKWKVKRSS